ncbi:MULTISPECIES: GNAT family protein [Streptomyces]|uniref:GNAT family protein n=1 Tax=Streptomyces solicathayae TaxID=3081768 RepID=A0ABZ0LKM7_9ACTN|nr:GNAT family protein [Streptomyces sp. HUAS YS2]WOX20044.1 GNAT family protein [Streptomyces sp. HUAS YS2]
MAAAGMVEEGTIREHVLKAGRWRDSVVHAILTASGRHASQATDTGV